MTIVNSYLVSDVDLRGPFVLVTMIVVLIIFVAIMSIVDDRRSITHNKNNKHVGEIIAIISCIIIEVLVAITCFQDRSHPRVKALLDNTIPFEEINRTYEYIGNEGDLRIFNVREDTEKYNKLMIQLREQK